MDGRRRRPSAYDGCAYDGFVAGALGIVALLVLVSWPHDVGAQTSENHAGTRAGKDLFVSSCASCHGAGAEGTPDGPSLLGVGAALVDFQLRTGRMPLADPDVQPQRKPPAFTDDERAALVEYVTSLEPGGPDIPLVDPASGDLSLGQQIFVANCAPCHGATGSGGAVGSDALAPSLARAAPIEIAEAIASGPGEMPVFEFDRHEQDSIVAFIDYLHNHPDRGGADIGGVGPVPEGFVAWGVGMGACFAIVLLVGHRRMRRPGEHT